MLLPKLAAVSMLCLTSFPFDPLYYTKMSILRVWCKKEKKKKVCLLQNIVFRVFIFVSEDNDM